MKAFTPITLIVLFMITLIACGDEETNTMNLPDEEQDLSCTASLLADDSMLNAGLGEAGDPRNWPAMPPGAVIASTYLRLQGTDDSTASFNQVIGPITAELMAPAPGLLGLSFTSSAECGTLRTLSAWESEEAMMDFVLGDAHLRAIDDVGKISRGGSLTGSWPASSLSNLEWETIAAKFADHEGPAY